jgi:pimeloyl-ACP methyl ester carboxylesterase
MALLIALTMTVTGPADVHAYEQDPSSSFTTELLNASLRWVRSPMWTGAQAGPTDSAGRAWFHRQFDDAAWNSITLPDSALHSNADDRYYRAHFVWDGASPVAVSFRSDDGLSIYINGQPLGSWGNGWRQSGCINQPFSCVNATSVPTQTVSNALLSPGDNVIAVDLWNAATCCFYYLDLVISGVSASAKPPIVLLPGFMGTRLSNRMADWPRRVSSCWLTNDIEVWPNITGLLPRNCYNDRIAMLQRNAQGDGPLDPNDYIYPSGVLTNLGPGLDFYDRFVQQLTAQGYTVFSFGYDWRLDLEENARKLDTFIASLPQSKVILIGHSQGGLLARRYIADAQRANHVSTVISVGTPYWGLPDLAYGMRSGALQLPLRLFVSANTTRAVIRNAPGMIQLLPTEAWFSQYGGYYTALDENLDSYSSTTDFFVRKQQSKALLEQARQLHTQIDDFRTNLPSQVAYYVLAAKHLPTVSSVREFPCIYGGICWDTDQYLPGDGTAPWPSTRLSGKLGDWSGSTRVCAFDAGQVRQNHRQLLADDFVIFDILHLLAGEQPVWCTYTDEPPPAEKATPTAAPSPFLQVSIWGQTEVSVTNALGQFSGISETGLSIEDIPGSVFRYAEMNTVILLPISATYTLTLRSSSPVPIQVRVTEFRSPDADAEFTPQQRAIFIDAPIVVSGTATLPINTQAPLSDLLLAVADAQGQPTTTLSPTAVLTAPQILDTTPPTTTITVVGSRDAHGFYTGQISVTLLAADTETGLLKTEYSLDEGQMWMPYTAPLAIQADRTSILRARSTDRAGNQEYPGAVQVLRGYRVYVPTISK